VVIETAADSERIVLVAIRAHAVYVEVADAVSWALFASFGAMERRLWSEATVGKWVADSRS